MSQFNDFCEVVLQEKKSKSKRVQGEKRERWRKFLKKAGLNPDMWWYDNDENEANLIDPVSSGN